MTRPALLTDRYELTMLSSFVSDGTVSNRAVFECFARKLPQGRRYGVFAGLGRLLPLIEAFTFDQDEIDWLSESGVINKPTARYLKDFRFTGNIDSYREGDVYFPNSPLLTVTSTLGEAVILETLILSVLNHDSAIAAGAARMVTAANGRPLTEMGSRRTHEEAAVASARAAYLAGFANTSNLKAGYTYGIPTVGTAAHAFTLAHESEFEAFRSQILTHGPGTTLLVDTYDTEQGIKNAVSATRTVRPDVTGPGAIRLDSGDLNEEAWKARELLDSLGAANTRIMVTSDLDEYLMSALTAAPIDGYGAGTRVATGSGHPTAGMVYKLVAIGDSPAPDAVMRPVAKRANGKVSHGGRKYAYRTYTSDGAIADEYFTTGGPKGAGEAIQIPVVVGGRVAHSPSLDSVRQNHRDAVAALPCEAREVTDGPSYLTTHPARTEDIQ